MPAGKYNMTIEQGADFLLPITVKDAAGNVLQLAGCDAMLEIRETKDAASAFVSLTETAGDDDEQLIMADTSPNIQIKIPAAITNDLDFDVAYYDLEIKDADGNIVRVLEGQVQLSKQVTRLEWPEA